MNKVEVYSHFFTVTKPSVDLRRILYNVAADYTVLGMVYDNKRRKRVWRPIKTFGFYTEGHDVFRFHNGQLGFVLSAAESKHIHLDVVRKPIFTPYPETYKVREKFKLRPDQEEASSFIIDSAKDGNTTPLLSMPTGTGKSQPLTAAILTPSGWRTMGEMYVGCKVTAPDGKIASVTGIYPQGLLKVWGFEFADGRQARSSADHLWSVYVNGSDEAKVMTTREIISLVTINPLINSNFVEIDLPSFRITAQGCSNFRRLRKLSRVLKGVNLFDEGIWEYSLPSKAVAVAVVDTLRSLGGLASMTKVYDDVWKVSGCLSPVTKRIRLTKIHIHNEPVECQCIAIDHPSKLYITNDYVVTHNTVTSLVTASRIGHRLSVSVLAGYVDKWVGDLIKTYEIEDSEIYRIEGRKSLVEYCQMVLELEKTPEKMPRATVISLNTIGKWQKKYIDNPADPELAMYGMKPWELMEKAKIGTNIFDENHQHLHAVYRMFTFLHIPQTISLSATLLSEDQTELRIQRMMYPRENRFEKIKMKKYIEIFACQYQIADLANARIQTTERGSNAYNHGAFEKSILANRTIRQQYIDMITRMVKGAFVETREDQDKCIVFVSSHAMAKELCRQLKAIYPDKDIRTYLEEDPLDNLMEPEICVTTVLSGGTAHDIPNLTVSIQTISLNSIKSNLQVLGRLREIPGKSTRFYYLYCSSIPKQVEYHTNKLTMFKDRCKEHKELILEPIRPKLGQNQQFHQHKFKQY